MCFQMYDLSSKLDKFYEDEVRLPGSEKTKLREKKDLNIQRLKDGLEEYNEENNTSYSIAETVEQGSIAMSTTTQNDSNDYDIDVAIIFDKENIGDLGPNAIKNVIVKALKKKCTNFKKEPEAKVNCVRIEYNDGYHVDFAIYRKKEDDVYEHAGSKWSERDPRAITNWFLSEVRETGIVLRKCVRLLKMFCKSRSHWRMPGGLIQTVLVDEKVGSNFERIDEAFVNTIKGVRDRLYVSTEINNPADETQSLLITESDKIEVVNLRNRLDKYIDKLNILNDSDCTEEDAMNAWRDFFNHDFWETEKTAAQDEVNSAYYYKNTEQFIESSFPIDLQNSLKINCSVEMNGFRPYLLYEFLNNFGFLIPQKKLEFFIEDTDVTEPYDIYWKVRNVGEYALKRDEIRGQIVRSNSKNHGEHALFKGPHFVECYIVKNGVCVARDRINVPIFQ